MNTVGPEEKIESSFGKSLLRKSLKQNIILKKFLWSLLFSEK